MTTLDTFRSVLVPIDLSPGSDRVIGRAAQLSLAAGARLALLHVVPRAVPARRRRAAVADARRALDAEAEALSRAWRDRIVVRRVVEVGGAAATISDCAASVNADLIVMGRGGGRALRDVFLGSTAERVLRRGQVPVLVVRLPARTRYRRPALAVDPAHATDELVASLLRIVPPPRPTVAVIHAYEVPHLGLIYPSLSRERAEEERDYYRRKALEEISRRLSASLARAGVAPGERPAWKMYIRHGSPRTIIEKASKETSTDLLILGTHGYSGVAHALLGTVAGDVLRDVGCDVLVVPPGGRAPGTT